MRSFRHNTKRRRNKNNTSSQANKNRTKTKKQYTHNPQINVLPPFFGSGRLRSSLFPNPMRAPYESLESSQTYLCMVWLIFFFGQIVFLFVSEDSDRLSVRTSLCKDLGPCRECEGKSDYPGLGVENRRLIDETSNWFGD